MPVTNRDNNNRYYFTIIAAILVVLLGVIYFTIVQDGSGPFYDLAKEMIPGAMLALIAIVLVYIFFERLGIDLNEKINIVEQSLQTARLSTEQTARQSKEEIIKILRAQQPQYQAAPSGSEFVSLERGSGIVLKLMETAEYATADTIALNSRLTASDAEKILASLGNPDMAIVEKYPVIPRAWQLHDDAKPRIVIDESGEIRVLKSQDMPNVTRH